MADGIVPSVIPSCFEVLEMRRLLQPIAVAALAALIAVPANAQATGVVADLVKDMHDVHQKLVSLAKATPADKYAWRPAAGIRSTGEVFLHVASDNYFIPAAIGVAADPSTGITATDMKSVGAYEKRALGVDATVAELNKSFAHLAKAMGDTPPAKLNEKVRVFGMEMTYQQLWIMTVTHLHEHLGQSIAYARSNGITPPWSK